MADVMDSDIDKGSCAHAAIKKNMVQLNRCVMMGCDIPCKLYAKEVIDEDTYDLSLCQIADNEKGRKLSRVVQKRVRMNPELMDDLYDILKDDVATKGLAEAIKNFEIQFKSLKEQLDQLKSDVAQPDAPRDAFDTCVKFKVEAFIKSSFEQGVSKSDIHCKLNSLCYESFTITPHLCDWVMEALITNAPAKPKVEEVVSSPLPKAEAIPEPLPLLPVSELKKFLYNSSLCCQAVSSCTASDYNTFFSEKNSCHKFEEISMSIKDSREEVDRYLIAIEGQTIYVAFKSEPTIQKWLEKYSSFSEGLEKQRNRIPLIFFREQLREQKKIILTGFSFGAMLACYIAAVLWKDSYIPIDVLEKNVVCITYGQPLIRIPFVQQVIKEFPHFQDTVYSIYDRDDLFPTILRYFSCTQFTSRRGNLTSLNTPIATSSTSDCGTTSLEDNLDLGSDQLFIKHRVSQKFLSDLSLLQKPEVLYSSIASSATTTDQNEEADALSRIKQDLAEAQPQVKSDEGLLCGRYYFQVAQNESQEFVWTKVPSKEYALKMLGSFSRITVDKLQVTNFSKHNMDEYQNKLCRGFLLKDPEKFLLPPSQTKFDKVVCLKPNVTDVSIHTFPNEHAVVLDGENLSFCYEIKLGKTSNVLKIKCLELVSTRTIQFNCPPDKTRNITISEDSKIKVELRSHFSNPIRKEIKVNKKDFIFSLREIQLAKYNPTEVIQLAFMSAMLERYSSHYTDQGLSKRLKHVTRFLEEAVKVVPLESIVFAVAYNDDSSAVECAKAIVASKLKFPVSDSMARASQLAAIKMMSGINGTLIARCMNNAIRQASLSVPSRMEKYHVSVEYLKTNELLQVSMLTPPPLSYAETTRRRQLLSPQHDVMSQITVDFNVSGVPRSEYKYPPSAPFFQKISDEWNDKLLKSPGSVNELSNLSIEHIYPIHSHERRHSSTIPTLQSPLEILHEARQSIQTFIEESLEDSDSDQHLANEKMLELVREIFDNKVKICATLLGAFIELQIRIPLLKKKVQSTADLLSLRSAPVAIGVWALFSRNVEELQDMLTSMRGNPLVVEIADYIAGVSDGLKTKKLQRSSKYDGKLQFLLQLASSGKWIACSREYVSYSLEHQLCSNLKFKKSISVNELIEKWDKTFEGDALSLVAVSYRPLIARWLKWAVLIHDLRLSLASYTCVGVTGLVNSGKSQLISKLFGIHTQVGTLEKTRTTVPLLYNLDGIVDGLDVIDFPGVDDKENNIPKLADVLLGLAQVVVFVCDYKKIFTDQAKQWLDQLKKQDVPVVLCLTFADELYSHFIGEDKGNPEPTEFKRREIGRELERKREKIGHHASRTIGFYCFHVPSGYKDEVNEKNLKKMGINTPFDVGHELVNVFKNKLKQKDVAKELEAYIQKFEQEV